MVFYALFVVDRMTSKDEERSPLMPHEDRKAKADQDAQYGLVGPLIPSRISTRKYEWALFSIS